MKSVIWIWFVLILVNAKAQNISYAEAERISYRLFVQGRWDDLITYGHKVIYEGVDFYYLRVRLGEAYMAKGKYRVAVKHLRKALEDNSFEDVFTIGLLYRAYLMSGQYVKAHALKKYLAEDDKTLIDAVSFYFGMGKAENTVPEPVNEPVRKLDKTSSYIGRLYMYKKSRLWTVTANMGISGERFYFRNKNNVIENTPYQSKMTAISFDKTVDAGKAFLFSFGFNPVWASSYNAVETASLTFRPSFVSGDNSKYTLIKTRNFIGNAVIGLTYYGTFCDVGAMTSLSYSTGTVYPWFGSVNGFITFYPLANNKWYLGIKIGSIFSGKNGKTIYSAFAGFNTKFFGWEGYYYRASDDMNYWYEGQGIFYLSNFPVVSAGGMRLQVFLSKKVTLFGGCGFVNYDIRSSGGDAGFVFSF